MGTEPNWLIWYRKVMALGLVFSLVVFLGHFLLPAKRVTLAPADDQSTQSLYGYLDGDTGISAYWRDQATTHWACHYKPQHTYGCGWDVTFNPTPGVGMDWNDYSAIELVVNYSGSAQRIRVFLRHFDPVYSDLNDTRSYKTMNMSFPVVEAEQPVMIDLREFQVVSWWFSGNRKHLQHPLPELSNITHLGVDIAEKGEHDVQIVSVTLVGQWIKAETLLFWMISFWMTVFLLDGSARFYTLYNRTRYNRQMIRDMEEKQRMMLEENQHLEELGNCDALTGVYNRAGLRRRIDTLVQRDKLVGAGVMILDLDHFKKLNDRYGHDMGDKVLRTFASLLSMNLRNDDIFARMGGEEFIVVCRRQHSEGVHNFAEKLRRLASQCSFNGDENLTLTISIGGAIAAPGEELADTLKRADIALYRAKQNGRNRVEFDSAS